MSILPLRRYFLHVRLLWRVAPRLSWLCLALSVLSAAAGTAALVTTGRLVGSIGDSQDTAWWWFACTAAVFVIGPVSSAVSAAVAEAISARYLVAVSDLTMQLGTAPDGIAHLEDPESHERLEALVHAPQDWLFVSGTTASWQVFSIRLSGAGAVVVLMSWSWWPPLLAVAAWMLNARAMGRWANAAFDDMVRVTGLGRRRARYEQSLLTGAEYAKEVRLFGLVDWLVDRYEATWRSTMAVLWSRRTVRLRGTIWSAAVVLAASTAVFGLLARDAWNGAVSVGSLVTLVQAVLALSAFGSLYPSNALARITSTVNELVTMRRERNLPPLSSGPPKPQLPAAPVRPASVEFRNVAFTYPSRSTPTISHLTLHVPAGQSVALVGINGAGKSTVIKLLCGLYRPESGRIRIGNGDPGIDAAARGRVAVIFQDFVQYHLPLRDNVGFGAVGNPAVVERALHDAGAGTLIGKLDTVLSSRYAGGTDLSGGQWQRVALARALAAVSAGAGVLVLDEPTAAQDVRAEAALFDRFLQVTRGVTTILVSHRLSSVRHAERIVVLDDPDGTGARVVEDGSHHQLMATHGRYARMFALQAARFAGTSR